MGGETFLQVQCCQGELCQWGPPCAHAGDPSPAALAASLVRAGLSGCSYEVPVRKPGPCLLLLFFFFRGLLNAFFKMYILFSRRL